MKKFSFENLSKIINNSNELDIENKLRKENNRISKENKNLKINNQKIENEILLMDINFNNGENISKEKEQLNKYINKNSLLIYKILNDIKDIFSLNNKIRELNLTYDGMKLDKLIYDNQILKYQKGKNEIRKTEMINKGNNLNILYNNAIKKKKDNQDIRISLENLIDAFNFRNNYINDEIEANQMIDSLLNQKQKLIEDKINIINNINDNININNSKHDFDLDKTKEELYLLKIKNKKLKDKLNKYNNLIKNMNTSLTNDSNKKNLEKDIDKRIIGLNEYKDKINNAIEETINKYQIEIKQKNNIMNKLKDKYITMKKNELSSIDNLML